MFGSAFNAHNTGASASRNLLTVTTPLTLQPDDGDVNEYP
jgi:hypothetical protein